MADWLAFAVLGVLVLVGGGLWAQRVMPPKLAGLLFVGLALRLVGSTARLEVMEAVYYSSGDSRMYFEIARSYAELIRSFDFGFMFGEGTISGQWWGTQFVRSVTGFVVFFTGDSIRAAFLSFSLFSFTGLVLCVRGFGRIFGEEAELQFARLVWLWPSLWFWPSSIGKEALMLLATGVTIWGYIGKGTPRWAIVLLGLSLTGAIRPHVATVTAGALLVAESLGSGSLLKWRRITGIIVAGALAIYSLQSGLQQMGLGDADLDGVQEHFEFRAGKTEQGGSRIATTSGWASVPMAFVTILARPFLWEARGIALVSALEISVFWVIVWVRRRTAWAFIKDWRSNAFARFSLVFTLGISLMYGLAFANLGIIARQRAVILPYLLTLAAGHLFAVARVQPVQSNATASHAPLRRVRI
ncbi:MAG TPA: hypothetical protein VJN18_13950 [Polyangiaceae bacterium]|nr:hypothetical protein [Polyangiaceae bacterium]